MDQQTLPYLRTAVLALAVAVLVVGVLRTADGTAGDAIAQPQALSGAQPARTELAPARSAADPADASDGRLVAALGDELAEPAANAAPTPAAPDVEPVTRAVAKRGGVQCEVPHRTVDVPRDLPVRSSPGGSRVGMLPADSVYLGSSMRAWVQAVTPDGRWGRVTVPWGREVGQVGWIQMTGLRASSTSVLVVSDLSERTVSVYRGCDRLFSAPTAIGASSSPSPTGRFWVTDPVAVPRSQPYFGSYAFGLSTIQPNPPAGWSGGNQMAIHGTNSPSTIGSAVSAGCLRVSEQTLARLRPLLRPGTPVVIRA